MTRIERAAANIRKARKVTACKKILKNGIRYDIPDPCFAWLMPGDFACKEICNVIYPKCVAEDCCPDDAGYTEAHILRRNRELLEAL